MELPEPFRFRDGQIEIELPGAHAVFTTRQGGCSRTPFDSLNLGFLTDDDPESVAHNRAALAGRLGVGFAYRRQVHGAEVHLAELPNGPGMPSDADGVVTATPGVGAMVLAADCVPLVIAGGGAVGALHAGWLGLAKGVLAAGVAALRAAMPGGGPAEGSLSAAIGPAAGGCCYEVGPEMVERFTGLGHGDRLAGRMLDLRGIAADQLRGAGVAVVHDTGLCTVCAERGLFYSHRRDGPVTGRQAGIGWLNGAAGGG